MRVKIFWYSILFSIIASGLWCRYITWDIFDEVTAPIKVHDKWIDQGGVKCYTNCNSFMFDFTTEIDPGYHHKLSVTHSAYESTKIGDIVYFTFERKTFRHGLDIIIDIYGFLITLIVSIITFAYVLFRIHDWASKQDSGEKDEDQRRAR